MVVVVVVLIIVFLNQPFGWLEIGNFDGMGVGRIEMIMVVVVVVMMFF